MMATTLPHDSTTVRTVIYPYGKQRLRRPCSQPKTASAGGSELPSPTAAHSANRHAEFYFTDEMTVFMVCGPF
jgi:hypothetical protein